MPSQIRVDEITNLEGTSGPEFPFGVSIPSGNLIINGDINITGVMTAGHISATNVTAGIVTAASFEGDASGLDGLPILGESKAIAFAIIQS